MLAWTDWSVTALVLFVFSGALTLGVYLGASMREEVWQRRMERVRRYRGNGA
jgi:hypothetical protein